MENHVRLESKSSTTEENASVSNKSYQLTDLANNRLQAVKSLATILLKEIELIETLTPKNDEVIKDENFSLSQSVERYESELIRTALIQTHGNQRMAARILGTKVTTLNMKLKRYGIDCREYTFFDSEYNN